MGVVEIEAWLHSMKIYDYDICNGVVHVVGDVYLNGIGLKDMLPVKFGYVSGNFDCGNNYLTSLHGCPSEVGGYFNVVRNQLLTLGGGPMEVGDNYCCRDNNLMFLRGGPVKVGSHFDCRDNVITGEPDIGDMKIGGNFLWQ